MLERPDERSAPVARLFARSKTPVARTLVGEGRRIAKVPPIRGSHGDRLPPLQWLGHARADRDEREEREKPNHFETMIAHGSA